MNEVSPNIPKTQQQAPEESPSKSEKESRVVALGGIRRVFRSRYGNAVSKKHGLDADDADGESVDSEDEQSDYETRVIKPPKSTTNNHYTLNLASTAPATKSDLPYTLSGSAFRSHLLVCC